ncbi:RtcB family protein [Candidatus Woesearchaeota archaeon]|nr:RtcB family protein [Candidatus Woesearchaeota archaeon]
MKAKKINDYLYEIPKTGNMKVPVKIFASDKLIKAIEDDGALQQGINVASSFEGIQKASFMMSDAHKGYGFPIGGVAAFDKEKGIITPGGIGFDINCGVRMLATNLNKEEVTPKMKILLDKLFELVPCGVGSESKIRLTDDELDDVLVNGSKFAAKKGYGTQEDVTHAEEEGSMKGCDPKTVSMKAKGRGRRQLGTLGAGNHFLEVQVVDEIYDEETAKTFGINKKGQVVIMIHCGSRGLGHQVCSDYIRKFEDEYPKIIESLPEKDLIYAPFNSRLGQDYYSAMIGSANYAWANRHVIAHFVRQGFKEVFGEKTELRTIYDVAHNIAKLEKHIVDGVEKELIVHRKGATRAFPPGRTELPKNYVGVGQPVILPGSMGTASYLLKGAEKAMELSFGSTAHGAGRSMGRFAAMKKYSSEQVISELEKNNILIRSASKKGIVEEAPGAYKDIDEVVRVSDKAGIAELVARVRPLGVIKG